MNLRAFARPVAIFLLAGALARADSPGFKAGFAERDITPDVGMEAPGGYGKAFHGSIHDPCKVRASVFDDGRSRVAVVGIDALSIRRDTVQKVRKAVEEKTGIPAGSILIGASHSHSSGPIAMILPGEFDHASDLIRHLAYDESTTINLDYLARVESALIDSIVEADARRVDALGGVGKGIEATVAYNRRFRMSDGRTVTHPGLGNPEIVEAAGPVDPEVGVIGAWSTKEPGKLLGCVVNFSCHATTSPGGASANYIYYLEKVIQGYYGEDCVVVFVAGASGDITQVDNRSPHVYPDGDRWAQRVGGKVGAEALKVLLTMDPGSLGPVGAKSRVWQIRRRPPSAAKVEAALAIVRGDKAKADPTEWAFAKETILLDTLVKQEPKVEVEVQAVQVGPAVFVTTEAEYFCRFGLEIKAGSGFPFTFPVSLANGCVGYVPTLDAFDPEGGGYETRLTSYSNLEITAGDQFRNAGIDLARQLKPGATPGPKARPPFQGKPWAYGINPPERE
ncbi:hypothetical protein P12x_002793 [Tundrisphaera lichenicola]|uniref:hypothetical protein n=1 Tax=Tundrisphaera lichenicola TaxID=2029860 RepID=UPI003EBC295C